MNNVKKLLTLVLAVTMVLSCCTFFCFTASAASAPAIVKDGLVAWYDGANNSNGEQDFETTVWKDLSGNGNHMSIKLNETNYWTDTAYHIDAADNYFPDAITEVVNGETYTIEFVAGELTYAATNWITLMCSDNDELSIFIRVPNGSDTDTNFEYKYNDNNQDRPKVDNGAETINDATVAITFDLSDPLAGSCIVYVNGVAMGQGVPTVTNIADSVAFGHSNPQRAWSGDIYGFRFYDRALTAEEVMKNSDADELKYRSGNYYAPVVEYDGGDEDIDAGLTGDFTSDVIPMDKKLDLIPMEGFYGTTSIIDAQVYNAEEWTGARFISTAELETDAEMGGASLRPMFYVNYQKYCRRTGVEVLKADDVQYVVAKTKVVGQVDEMYLRVCAGDNDWYASVSAVESWYYGFAESEDYQYMLYEVTDMYTGDIHNLHFEIAGLEGEEIVYVEEVRLFTDAVAAFAYAGIEMETEEETTEATEETTEATEVTTEAATQAPAVTTEATGSTESGCASSVAFGAVAVVAAAAAFVALKKDRE